jgi:predicted nucleic acid-binding protein
MALPLLDTNVLIRHLTSDNDAQSPRASALIARIAAGELFVAMSEQVIFETAFTLEKVYKVPRAAIADGLESMLALEGIVMGGKDAWKPVFDLFVSRRRLSFVDCYHVAYMRQYELTEILTWDQEFDRIPGITRIEP